jgi:small subunit ribosomal protein S9
MAETRVENPDTNKPAIQISESQTKTAPNPAGQAKGGFWWGTGRRKCSVARVRIKPGSGKLVVNKKELDEYFKREQDRKAVVAPLKTVHAENNFDIFINVRGGGTTGQAGASLLGIARALRNYDINLAVALRDGGHLTRDPRMVERKKPGQSGARKRYQFSKR